MSGGAEVGAPYTHAALDIRRVMGWVMVALTPATLWGLWNFGWPALFLWLVTVGTAVVAEAVSLALAGRSVRAGVGDGSALVAGWLLAMTLPPWAPWWIGVVGGLFAIVVGKHVFGGLGQNLFNPAMTARVALLISFPLPMTTFVAPAPWGSGTAPGFLEGWAITFGDAFRFDTMSAASPMNALRTTLDQGEPLSSALAAAGSPGAWLLGTIPGSLGETSALLLLAGGVILLVTRTISWVIPGTFLGTLAVLSLVTHQFQPEQQPGLFLHVFGGATMLAAFFIATDPVTSPVTRLGQIIFAMGAGALTFVIRNCGGYPEGVGFAILLMNGCTPLIDRYVRPRVYGRTYRGAPRQPEKR